MQLSPLSPLSLTLILAASLHVAGCTATLGAEAAAGRERETARLRSEAETKDAERERNTAAVGECLPNAYPGDPALRGQAFRLEKRDVSPAAKGKTTVKDTWAPCTPPLPGTKEWASGRGR